jgi:molybdopterin synthase sulfur carrier subunit
MQITVQGYLTLKAALGRRVFDLADHPPPTLQDLLDRLQADLGGAVPGLEFDPQTGKPAGALALLLNGRHLSHLPTGLNTILKDGDILSVFPPIAGG